MNSWLAVRTQRLLFVLTLELSCGSSLKLCAQDVAAPFDEKPRLRSLSEASSSEFFSAKFKCRFVFRDMPNGQDVNLSAILESLREGVVTRSEESLVAFLYSLDPRLKRESPPWTPMTHIFRGDEVREDSHYPNDEQSYVRRQEQIVRALRRNNQINIDPIPSKASRRRIAEVQDFIPGLKKEFWEQSRIVSEDSGYVLLSAPNLLATLDSSNGHVVRTERGKLGEGHYSIRLHGPLTTYGQYITIPAWVFEMKMNDKNPNYFSLRIVDDAIVNDVVLDTDFWVEAEAGDVIHDRRRNEHRVYRCEKHMSNVLDYDTSKSTVVDRNGAIEIENDASGAFGKLFWLNVAVVVAVGVMLAARKSKLVR